MTTGIASDPIPAATKALVALDAGDVKEARKQIIAAGVELQDMTDMRNRLERRNAELRAALQHREENP